MLTFWYGEGKWGHTCHAIHRLGISPSHDLQFSQSGWAHAAFHWGHHLNCWKLAAAWKTFTARKKIAVAEVQHEPKIFSLLVPSKGSWEDKNFYWVIEHICISIIKSRIKITVVQVLWGAFDNIHFHLIHLF